MELTYLLDTNVLILLLRGRAEALRPKLKASSGRLAVSTVSVAELEFGLDRSTKPEHDHARVEGLLSLLRVLPFDRRAAHHAGRIASELNRRGTPIGPYDTLIAGHARSQGLVVVTTNFREFARVPGLQAEDWTTDA